MKIVVAYKWAADPQEATVAADGQVDFSRAKSAVSDYDAVAITVARHLGDTHGADVVGLTVGGPEVATGLATKAALSRGLDALMVVADPALKAAGTTGTAQALATALAGVDDIAVLITGDSSVDVGAKLVPAVVGGLLGWPVLTEVTAVAIEPGALVVERAVSGGTEQLRIDGPAVLAVATDAATVKAPGMKDVLAAAKKPVQQLPADPVVADGTPRSTARLSGPARRGIQISTDDPAAAAAELVSALRADGVLIGGQQ